jgi:hypothetical protein
MVSNFEKIEVAIDPAALVLRGKLLLDYYEIHHPNVPIIDSIEKVLAKASAAERTTVSTLAKKLAGFAAQVEKVSAV